MDYGLTGLLSTNALTSLYKLGGAGTKGSNVSFMDLASATKATSSATTTQNIAGANFKEMCQARFPGA